MLGGSAISSVRSAEAFLVNAADFVRYLLNKSTEVVHAFAESAVGTARAVTMKVSSDPRLQAVLWRDLLRLNTVERTYELLLSLPWFIATLCLLHNGWYKAALLTSFFFFLTGLRQIHNACHYMSGIPRWACDVVLFVLSVLMLSAMHAVQVTHMHHHRHCLDDHDIEAATAKVSGWRALLLGPIHPVRLHYWGF